MYASRVNRLTPELERDVRAYMDEAFGREFLGPHTPLMRTVKKSIPVEHAVATSMISGILPKPARGISP
jgi:hypothetical protein